jgi:hypothetical protein
VEYLNRRWENDNFVSIARIYVVANFRFLMPMNYAVIRQVYRLVHSYNLIKFSNFRLSDVIVDGYCCCVVDRHYFFPFRRITVCTVCKP